MKLEPGSGGAFPGTAPVSLLAGRRDAREGCLLGPSLAWPTRLACTLGTVLQEMLSARSHCSQGRTHHSITVLTLPGSAALWRAAPPLPSSRVYPGQGTLRPRNRMCLRAPDSLSRPIPGGPPDLQQALTRTILLTGRSLLLQGQGHSRATQGGGSLLQGLRDCAHPLLSSVETSFPTPFLLSRKGTLLPWGPPTRCPLS